MPGFDANRFNFRPVFLEIFAENPALRIVQAGNEEAVQVAGAILKRSIARRVEGCNHRLEQMHLRILPTRDCGGNSLDEAAMRGSQLAIDKREQGFDLVPNLGIPAQLVYSRQREEHE